jgi:hypothetical protein
MREIPENVGGHYLRPEGFRLPAEFPMLRGVSPRYFGPLINEPARQVIAQHYNFPLDPKAPSTAGPDIIVPKGHRIRVGFDIAVIKPLSVDGVVTFWKQLDRWRDFGWEGHPPFQGRAAMFGYDTAGILYLYGIFDM